MLKGRLVGLNEVSSIQNRFSGLDDFLGLHQSRYIATALDKNHAGGEHRCGFQEVRSEFHISSSPTLAVSHFPLRGKCSRL